MYTFLNLRYTNLGGAEKLIIRFAERFQHITPIKIVGSRESYVYKYLTDNNIAFQFQDIEAFDQQFITDEDIVIQFSSWDLIKLKSNPYTIIWNIHPDIFLNWNLIHPLGTKISRKPVLFKLSTKRLINLANQKNGLFFMDREGYNNIAGYFKLDFHPQFLPIPIDIPIQKDLHPLAFPKNNEEISITYLGRGDDMWKIYPLEFVCRVVAKTKTKANIYIITTTDDLFKKELAKYSSLENIKIRYVYSLEGAALKKFLIHKSDLHVAMGTSALEGASCRIPTILVDVASTNYPDSYKFRWLHQTADFTLGRKIYRRSEFDGYTIDEILDQISTVEKWRNVGQKDYNYVLDNHSMESFFHKLTLIKSKVKYQDVYKLTPMKSNKLLLFLKKIKAFLVFKNNS